MSTPRASHDEVRAATDETARSMTPQNIPVNAYETPGAFVIVAPFPAVKENDVCVELTDGEVRFWAALRSSGPREYVIHEWEYGGYERSVVDPARIRLRRRGVAHQWPARRARAERRLHR